MSTGGKRKRYLKLTDEQWAAIGRYAAWLIFTYKSLTKDGCPTILIDMETSNATTVAFLNSSINTLCEILRDNTCFYAREHRKIFVTWCQIFPQIAH